MKKLIYIFQTLLGLLFIALSWYMVDSADPLLPAIVYGIPSFILFVSGIACILFGVDTYLLRDDADIWR